MSATITPLPAHIGEHPFTILERSPFLLQGDGTASITHDLINYLIARQQRLVVADGANRFNVYALTRAAQRLRKPPSAFLSSVRVSRSFTWQQYVALLEDKIGPEAARFGARWVIALGPLNLFADTDINATHATLGTWRVAEALAGIARRRIGVVVAQDATPLYDSGRINLLDNLKSRCPSSVTVRREPGGHDSSAHRQSDPDAGESTHKSSPIRARRETAGG